MNANISIVTVQLQHLDGYAVGPDSYYVPRFIQRYTHFDADVVLAQINEDAPWTNPSDVDFRYRGNALQRQKAFLTRAPLSAPVDQPPAVLFRYSYPGFQYGSMLSYRPFHAVPAIHEMATFLEQEMEFEEGTMAFNHVIATRYRDATDNIGWHADKTKDITWNTPIVMLSLGETRELQLGVPSEEDGSQMRITHAIPFAHGDLFALGPLTNSQMKHRITTVAQESVMKRKAGEAVAPRVSLVFREIEMQITLNEVRQRAQRVQRGREQRQQARNNERGAHEEAE